MKSANIFQTKSSDGRRVGTVGRAILPVLKKYTDKSVCATVCTHLLFSLLVALMISTAGYVQSAEAEVPSIVSLDDINGDGSPEVSVLMQTTTGENYAYVVDASNGAQIRRVEFDSTLTPISQVVVPDINGSGSPEIAMLSVDPASSVVFVVLSDASTGGKVQTLGFNLDVPPISHMVVPDINSNGFSEIAVLSVTSASGDVSVYIKDAKTPYIGWSRILFDKNFPPVSMAVVPDINGNGISEIAVLGVNPSNGNVKVDIKDASTSSEINRIYFDKNFPPIAMKVVEYADGAVGIAILGVNPLNDNVKVVIKDTATRLNIGSALWFDKEYPPVAVAVVPDSNGNGAPEIAVLGVRASDGQGKIVIKDASTGAKINGLFFDGNYSPIGMTVLPDMNGNSASEIAVLGVNQATGQKKVIVKDLLSAELISKFSVQPQDKWVSISPGAGGVASAIATDPDSDIVLAGSDVGGMRHSSDGGGKWKNVSKGVVQKLNYFSAMNFHDVEIFTVEGRRVAVATTTPGVIYWSYITENYMDTKWEVLFDSQVATGWEVQLPFGPVAASSDGSRVFVGVGNLNKLVWNKTLPAIPAGKAGTVLVFDATLLGGEVTFEKYAEINVGCADPTCQVTDLDSPDFALRTPYVDAMVSTTEGVYELVDDGGGLFTINPQIGNLPAGARFIGIAGTNAESGNVVVLLDEAYGDATMEKGAYLTTGFGSASPTWESRNGDPAGTSNLPFANGMGILKRSRINPAEVVVSMDKKGWGYNKGIYLTTDINATTPTWVKLIDADDPVALGGWTRFDSYNNMISEIAIKDGATGISDIYVGGFSDLFLRGERNGDTFDFRQIYCTTKEIDIGGELVTHYKSRGMIELSVPTTEVYINPANTNQIYNLYMDNMFFVSPNRGNDFSRPIGKWNGGQWGTGTGVVFDGSSTYISYVKGNSLNSASAGGIIRSTDDGKNFEKLIINGLPADPVISAFIKLPDTMGGYFVSAVWNEGVYISDDAISPTNWSLMGLTGKKINKFVIANVGASATPVLFASSHRREADGYLINYYADNAWNGIPLPADRLWSTQNFRNVNGYLVLTEGDNDAFYTEVPVDIASIPSISWTKVGKEFTDIAYYAGEYYIATSTDGIHKATDFTDTTTWQKMPTAGLGGTKTFKYISLDSAGRLYVGANGAWGFFRFGGN